MDVTLSELLVAFLESPLVLWVRTLGPLGSCDQVGCQEPVNIFIELVDGVFLHNIMTHIDPSPNNHRLNKNVGNDVSLRLHNLTLLTRHIRTYYQDTLQQLIVMPLPNLVCIARDPVSAKSMEELKRLLLLILGCAVQCERKEEMIEKIKLLDMETQASIVSYIQEVTHNQQNVLDLSWLEEGAGLAQEVLEPLSRSMATSLRHLVEQRDMASELIVELSSERDYLCSLERADLPLNNGGAALTKEEKQHVSVELADTKAKLRRSRQELEEKTEHLMDSRHEVERQDQEIQRLKQENQSLSCEARSVRLYRDEVDSLREKGARVERLETELSRCKEKLNDVHFYKARMEELREDNLTLMDTKMLLEEQLAASRGRCDKVHTLEKDNLLLQAKIHHLEMERESDRQRVEDLQEENMLLEIRQKQSMNESAHLGWELEQLSKHQDNCSSDTRKSLVHELNECVSSRVLKLEKENGELQASVERLQEEKHLLQERELHGQVLERENQALSKKVEHLQALLEQEKVTSQDLESLGEELLKDKHLLERQMHLLRADKDRQISEMESKTQNLCDAVASLRERAQTSGQAGVPQVEAENRLLQRRLSDTGARLSSLETEVRLSKEEEVGVSRCDEAERSRDALSMEVATLRACSERSDLLKKEVSSMQQEVLRLTREAEEAQQVQADQQEDLEKLTSSSALLTKQLEEAQTELQEVHRRFEEVEAELQGERKRSQRLEANVATVTQEKFHLKAQVDELKEERDEHAREKKGAWSRLEELKGEVEQLSREQRKREEGDKDRERLQLDLDQSDKTRKHLEKESWRMRMLLDNKEAELEEKARQLAGGQREVLALSRELDRMKEVALKTKEWEQDYKELQKQATMDKRTLATLREELVSEKLSVQQLSVELERLNEELEKVGLTRERLLQQEQSLEESKYKLLESRLEETVQEAMKMKEGKLASLQKKVEESNTHNTSLRAELAAALQKGEGPNLQELSKDERRDSATTELLHIKDHLIDVEKNNASLQTQSRLLMEQLRQLDNTHNLLNNQMAALQRHTTTLQEQNTSLHTRTAQLQVENSTLSSQSASLMAQNAVLQGQVSALETEVESWRRQREEAWRGRESVLEDHQRLLSIHERQVQDYEGLISQHAALKLKHRALDTEHNSKYCTLLQQKEKLEELAGRGEKEREELTREQQKNGLLRQENLQLRADVDRLSQSQSQQSEQSDKLQQRMNQVQGLLSAGQQEVSSWMARYDSLMEQHQGLDLTMTKVENRCELLGRLKGNLEEENHHLLSQINLLSQQNHALLERSMESKELYHQEQKLYIDKLNALRRQKEKLEEKIMDQYKFYEPTPKKRSQWSGAKALAKFIKPRKENSRERGSERDREGTKDRDRERAKSAPDIPLPAPPLLLPPETPPLPPQRTGSDSQDNGHTHSSPRLGPQSPPLTPSSRGVTERGRGLYRSGEDPHGPGVLLEPDSDIVFGHMGGRPGSADLSHHTSSSNSPVKCKDASDCQHWSGSLSSDDVLGLSQSQQTLSRSATLPYDHSPQQAQPQRRNRNRARPSSPGSEMVTLEEFLQESSVTSPQVVSLGSKEDLMKDYFTRSPDPTGSDHVTPTSYVTPTVHTSTQRPGQSVKPSPRQPVGQSPGSSGPVTPRGQQSLSRTFSLASADLLRSNGPDTFQEGGTPKQPDLVIRRQGGARGRERPLSARLAGSGSILASPVHHSSSLTLQTEREGDRGRTPVTHRAPPSTCHHRGEVAMVTPVRAVSASQLGEASAQDDHPSDSFQSPDAERPGCSTVQVQRPTSTPASPDPNNDPQTVWYEYGCV